MKIGNYTGGGNFNVKITKSIGGFLIGSLDALTGSEKISVTIERSNGANVDLVRSISLKSYLAIQYYGRYGKAGNFPSAYGHTIYEVPLSIGGGIYLGANDYISVELTGIDALNEILLFGLEEPNFSNKVHCFEEKIIASDEKEKVFNLLGYNFIDFAVTSDVTSLIFNFKNGKRIEKTADEMVMHSNLLLETNNLISENWLMPLNGLSSFEVRKNVTANPMTFLLRKVKTI